MFLIRTLHQFEKDFFVALSTSVIKNSNIFQKNSVYPKNSYLHSFPLLTSTSLQNLSHRITRNRYRNCYTLNKKKFSSLTRNCNLATFRATETITNLTQCELFQEESDLLKAGLYFLIQPDKIRKSEIFIPLKRFIVHFLTILNPRKPKVR